MRSGFANAVGDDLEGLANVDNEGVRDRRHGDPSVGFVECFKTCDGWGGLKEERPPARGLGGDRVRKAETMFIRDLRGMMG